MFTLIGLIIWDKLTVTKWHLGLAILQRKWAYQVSEEKLQKDSNKIYMAHIAE